MGKSCCAVGCSNRFRKGSGVNFYRFPEDKERKLRWIAAVGRKDWMPTKYTWLCSDHFISGSKSNDPLSPDYVPSVFAHASTSLKRKAVEDMARFKRSADVKKRRQENTIREEVARTLLQLSDTGNGEEFCEPHTGTGTMTDMSTIDIEKSFTKQAELETLVQEYKHENECLKAEQKKLSELCNTMKENDEHSKNDKEKLKEQIQDLKAQINKVSISQSTLEGNDKMVKYYTGLPDFATLQSIFQLVYPNPPESRSRLTLFQQLCAVLMKLRLGLGDQDLAYRFQVDQTAISRYVKRVIDHLYIRLNPLVRWPERHELMETMPVAFRKNFSKCVTIIDCFEVFIERPTSLKARAQTWSNYKHHNTVKFLIGIAPQGVVTFISKGWGGRVSDVHLTENSGLLDKLSPGDLILADRGFNIHDSAGLYCAVVKLPPFTKGKPQLTKSEVDFLRQLSRVRIHVERVIGVLRQKYSIFGSTLPIN